MLIKSVGFVRTKHKFVLGIGFLAIFFSAQGLGILATPYYQMTLGVDPFLLALAMKAPVFIASFLAPFIGQWSDGFRSSFGRRRPFLFVFPWLSCLIFGLIWMVPQAWSREEQLVYFAIMALAFYLCNTCWTIPMKCLAYEASSDYHERTRIMGFVTYFLKFGSIIYHWVFPIAQLSIFGGVVIGMQYVGWGVALICLGLFGMIPAIFLRERTYEPSKLEQKHSLIESLKTILQNKNLRILLLIIFFQMGFGGLAASMDYYVLVYYMHEGNVAEGATWKGLLSTAYAIAGIASIPLITKLSSTFGKINAIKFMFILTFVGGLLKWVIYQPGNEWLLVIDAVICCGIWAAMGILVTSMVADQIDVDEHAHDIRREGIFVSLQNWFIAISGAIAVILSGLMLNLIGFEALEGGNQTDTSLNAMRFILVFGTAFPALLGYKLISQYDLTEQRFNQIKAEIKTNHPSETAD